MDRLTTALRRMAGVARQVQIAEAVDIRVYDPPEIVWGRLLNAQEFLPTGHSLHFSPRSKDGLVFRARVASESRGSSWSRTLDARVEPTGSGSRIQGFLQVPEPVRRFTTAFVVLARVFAVLILVGSLAAFSRGDLLKGALLLAGILVPMLLILALAAQVAIGLKWSKTEEALLLRLLRGNE